MELYRDIHEIFKPSLLKYNIKSLIPFDIPLWKTNTGQKRLSFFGSKINHSDCNGILTHNHLVCKRTLNYIRVSVSSKEFLDIQETIECRFTLKRLHDMIRTYSQINSSNKNANQRLLSCIL